ncbi:MAG: hypothetical protein JNK82_30530 [Myxococcaceae bacterium]|nr:hypothetical protein [Myxococcaceae bacterium]
MRRGLVYVARMPEVRTARALAAFFVAAFAGFLVAYWPYTVDDTFIFLRYAQSFAEGHGLTFNPGQPPAEGYTSLSWTLLLTLPHLVGVTGPIFAKGFGVLCALGSAALAALLAWRLSGRRALAPALAVAFVLGLPATAVHAVSGMETAFAALLVTVWLVTAERAHAPPWRLAGLGLALGLTRPEGNLFVAAGLVLVLLRLEPAARKPLARAVVLGHALPGAVYFAWRATHYGHFLPLPFYVKTVAPNLGPFAGWPQGLDFLRLFTVENPWLFVLLAVAVATVPFVRLALAAAAVWWAFFLFPAHEMGYDLRYLYPLVPGLLACAAAGGAGLAQRYDKYVSPRAAALLCTLLMVASFWHRLPGSVAEKRDYGRGGEKAHVAIGAWLASIRPKVSRPVVATLDSGAIAYVSRWQVIDTWGLNDPEIALAAAGKGRDADAVLARSPSVIIVISQFPDRFVHHFDYEGPLYEKALAKGYRVLGRWEFLPDYHLWALGIDAVPAPP